MTQGFEFPGLSAVVLAAGRSQRMGKPKAFLPDGAGETFLGRILRTLRSASAGPLIVVGAPDWSENIPELTTAEATLVINRHPERGQLSSLQCGLAAAPRSTGMLVTLVDVPFVMPETVARLVMTWSRTRADVVRPANETRHGHPIVIGPSVIADLLKADTRATARSVLAAYVSTTVDVYTNDPGPFTDIDTPDD